MKALDRMRYAERIQVPQHAVAHGKGTDVEADLPILYKLVHSYSPEKEIVVVELGTRQAVSTRTLAWVCERMGGHLYTIDPDPACRPYVITLSETFVGKPLPFTFVETTGELAFAKKMTPRPTVLFVDTDPHTYDQTMLWLETWMDYLLPGGCAAFHDTVPARPEIQVADAVRDWVKDKPDYLWVEMPTQYGLGILWKP